MFYVPSFQSRPSRNMTYHSSQQRSSETPNMIFTMASGSGDTKYSQTTAATTAAAIPSMKPAGDREVSASKDYNNTATKQQQQLQKLKNNSSAVCVDKVIQKLVKFDERYQDHPSYNGAPADYEQAQRLRELDDDEVYDSRLRRSTSLFGPPKRREAYCFPINHQHLNSVSSLRHLHRSISSEDRTCSSVLYNSDVGGGDGIGVTEDLWQRSKQDILNRSRQRREELENPGYRRIVINVSGMIFEIRAGVLECHPKTLLGDPCKRARHFDKDRKEYFFDRHRPTFEAIFNYYQYGGRLKRPIYVPDEIFLTELEFYEIETEAVDDYKRDEGYVIDKVVLPENKWQKKVWMLFEFPETSSAAFIIAILSVVFTVISIILLCVETLPEFSETHCVEGAAPNFIDPFFILETFCTSWFTLEVIVRFFSCPSKKDYCKDLKNAIDICAIVPYYVTLFNVLITYSCSGAKNSASLAFLRVIRLIRVFKLTKHSPGLQVLVLTFRASLEGLGLFLVALIVCILVFSSTIYYVEVDEEGSQIESIPDAFWWAIITMCTVGYGDKVPKGHLGKLVGSVCAVAGVLTLAIPVPIITENFNKFYTHKNRRRY